MHHRRRRLLDREARTDTVLVDGGAGMIWQHFRHPCRPWAIIANTCAQGACLMVRADCGGFVNDA